MTSARNGPGSPSGPGSGPGWPTGSSCGWPRRCRRCAALPAEAELDLVFIDADKPNYGAYWDELVPRVRPGGLLLADNVLWSGDIVEPAADDQNRTALRQFNDKVAADPRVELIMLTAFDGLTIARKL